MTCKYLSKTLPEVKPGESYNTSKPGVILCNLEGREADYKKCSETPNGGPCWWWQEKHPDALDLEFSNNS